MADITTNAEGTVFINDQPLIEIISELKAKLQIAAMLKRKTNGQYQVKFTPNQLDTFLAMLEWLWVTGTAEPPEEEPKKIIVNLFEKPL